MYPELFQATHSSLDDAEKARGLEKPLLPFLMKLNDELPKKWDRHSGDYGPNDDWLLWALRDDDGGAKLENIHGHSA